MIPQEISIFNWRKFKETDFSLPKNSFYILDTNGAGKTSLLSGVYTLLTGLPFPGTKFKEAVKTGENYFGLKSENGFVSGILTTRLTIKKEGEFLSHLQVHTYVPSDNLWFFNSRGGQLSTWDIALAQVFGKKYSNPLKNLEQAIKAKNSTLKNYQETGRLDENLMKNYTRLIEENSQKIWALRDTFFQELSEKLVDFKNWTNVRENLQIEYLKTNNIGIRTRDAKSTLGENDFKNLHQKEKIVGRTLYGANRDEINLLIQNQPISTQFSRGEMRAFIIFLKKFIREKHVGNVVWLLDDIFNEFDEERENIILKTLIKKGDFLIATGTKPLPNESLKAYKLEDLIVNKLG